MIVSIYLIQEWFHRNSIKRRNCIELQAYAQPRRGDDSLVDYLGWERATEEETVDDQPFVFVPARKTCPFDWFLRAFSRFCIVSSVHRNGKHTVSRAA